MGNELLNQIYVPPGAETAEFMPYEVGDYSIYIHENLDGIYQIGIFNDKGNTYISKEILASSEGSIVYFNEKITPNIKAEHIYIGWVQRYYYNQVPEILYREGKISLADLLNFYKYEYNPTIEQLIYGKLKRNDHQ